MTGNRDPPLVDFESGGYLDAAETFNESDVTLTHTDTVVSSQSVGIRSYDATNRGSASNSNSQSDRRGQLVEPHANVSGLEVTVDSNTDNATYDVEIRKHSDGSLVKSFASVSLASGSTYQFNASLSGGVQYRLLISKSDGTTYTVGYNSPSLPIQGTDLTIHNGIYNGSSTNTTPYAFDTVRPIGGPSSGTTIVEWSKPNDVYRWDSVLFQRSTDGETVDLYLEESTDGGSTWSTIAGPVARGQEITAAPDSKVRVRVELSRSSYTNNPTLDSVHRRYVV